MKQWVPFTGIFQVRGHRLLVMYSYYSLALSLVLMMASLFDDYHFSFGRTMPEATHALATLYVFSAAIFVVIASNRPQPQWVIAYLFVEIILLSLLILTSGRTSTGIENLLFMPLVIANLLAPGVLGYAVAAWASLTLLYTHAIWPEQIAQNKLLHAGLYGGLAFLLAWVTQSVSHLLNSTLNLVNEQAARFKRLRRIGEQILQYSQDGIIACDSRQRVVFFNPQAAGWFSLQENALLPEELQLQDNQHTLSNAQGKFYVRKQMVPMSDSGDFILVIEEHARFTAEAQQVKLASLGRLTASIAHEIRNPLSALRQASQLLEESEHFHDEDRVLTNMIEQNCQRINRIIEDIFQLSRREPSIPESIRLKPWLEHFHEQFRQIHAQANFQFTIQCPERVMVYFDAAQLQQILHILCDNGLRYALRHQPDSPCLTLTIQAINARFLTLEIQDNGGGISPEHQQHLFEPFYTTEHQGTGLGLYISRELCEANQAKIQHHNTDQGSCFTLLLKTA